MKKFVLTLALLVFLVSFSFLQVSSAGVEPSGFCDSKCQARCAKASVQDSCLKYCNVCCKECKCVPSGTYGRKDECPCYRDKRNRKGKSKCP